VATALVGVYRARNAHFVTELCEPALARGWTVAWWALDETVDDLAPFTVGSGPGAKFDLLNRVVSSLDEDTEWLVVSDDDLIFERGDVVDLQRMCRRAGFDLAQPARSEAVVDHEITARRDLSVARRTSFVEIGPIFVVGPGWRDRIVPFPEGRGMGWGLELEWYELLRAGCVLGIIDSMSVRHTGARGVDYDMEDEFVRLRAEFGARGLDTWSDVQLTFEIWRPWMRRPPWRWRWRRAVAALARFSGSQDGKHHGAERNQRYREEQTE
jgi:hypothetical protein